MTPIRLRKGRQDDNEFLFNLFRQTMREYIEQAWGWDELLQCEAFRTHLPGPGFQILELNRKAVGGYQLKTKADHLWLELILLTPALQGQGHGSYMLEVIKKQAWSANIPVRLACLRCNPAWKFYHKRGFTAYAEDEKSVMMVWHPDRTSPVGES